MNNPNPLHLKLNVMKSATLQPKLLNEVKQNTLKRNRKDTFVTRSVWYENDDNEGKKQAGYALRKASSLDSLLVTKSKPNNQKITKDMISKPVRLRKITNYWISLEEKNAVAENSNFSDKCSDCEIPNEKTFNLSNQNEKCNEQYISDCVQTENSTSFNPIPTQIAEVDEIVRKKETTNVIDYNRRKNILHFTDNLENDWFIDKTTRNNDVIPLNQIDQQFGGNENINKTDEPNEGGLSYSNEVGEELENIDVTLDESSNLMQMKHFSESTPEVLRTLQSNTDEPLSRNVGPFPHSDDHYINDDIQLRPHRLENRLRQSKTIDGDPRRYYKNQDFEIRGCVKIQLPDNVPIKIKKNEYLQYQNSSIIKRNETNTAVLKFGVVLKSAKLSNKREVELRDTNNHIYLLTFDSSKEAKQFIESDKVSSLVDSEKSTITKTLLRLLGKRSSREVLEKKGIYQNEPIFGNTLKNIYNAEKGVPRFILKTMELIERPDNITSLGLYRTSGNLATIQKIRLEVDKGNLEILDVYAKDPDVLTGSLKLFFRELKEPLLSCKTCDNLLEFTKNDKSYCKKDRDNIRTILSHIPESNTETLLALIRHLIEVVKYKDHNKMDTYNLAVCWGPTIIFATDNFSTKDLVTQSAEATKLFDALLSYYINNPDELELKKKKPDYFDSNRNMIHRQDSRDSIHSSDSNNSSSKKSSSNLSLDAIDDVLKKSVELIESHMDYEGIYRKPGSHEKVNKIVRKMLKRKLSDLDKYRNDVYDLTDSLKRYIREGCDSFVTKETIEHVNRICDNTQWLEHNTRQKVIAIISEVPKKDTLIFIIQHLIKLIKFESFHNVTKSEMLHIWTRILNEQLKIAEFDEKMFNFLKILVDVFDETKSDVSVKPKGMSNGLLNDLKNLQKEKDRSSKYDNVPDEGDYFSKEATIMEEKTEDSEQTKL